jgi:transposase
VIETIRPKYACKACEKTGLSNTIKIAPVPPSPIPKGIATASLLSQIICGKYQYALPLYRQETLFGELGITLSRQTMSDWIIKTSALFAPVYDLLKASLLQQRVIHADETTVNVINSEKTKSYMWVYCSGSDKPRGGKIPNIVLFDYHNSRAASCVVDYLGDYTQYLQVDGYQAYGKTKAKLACCMAHARRKFIEAQTAQGKTRKGKADVIINLIAKLYKIESQIKGKEPEEKVMLRQKQSTPIIDKITAWVIEHKDKIPPTQKLGEAIRYWLNQESKLRVYLEDGNIAIDNNRAERAVKPFVIGRKNWLFSNTERGASASAMLYSIIESAKANDVHIESYMTTCLDELAKKPSSVEHLLPWRFNR